MPNSDVCIVEEKKVRDYLLNTTRMPAAAKARFFLSCGFSGEDWRAFARALKAHGNAYEVLNEVVSGYGTKYEIEGPLTCPDGRKPVIRTVWQINRDELAPRLITAYPAWK
jgi:hypothetical protein